ncbi:hypothetical protein Tco_1448468 [Tanacetum coccineum]
MLKPSTRKEPTFSQESQSIADVVASTDVLPIQKHYEEFDNVESFEHLFMAEPKNAESTVQFDVEEYEEHQENPNQETPTEFPNLWEHTAHAREEFLKMKCCSFQKKDLEKHYDRMSQRFYCLNGVDDVNLKQVFLNSFLESLGNEAYRDLEARNVTIAQTTLGELYQLILNALAKLCN